MNTEKQMFNASEDAVLFDQRLSSAESISTGAVVGRSPSWCLRGAPVPSPSVFMPSEWLGPQNGEKGPWKGRCGAGSGKTQRHREAVDRATNLHGLGGKEAGKLEALGGNCLGGEVQGRTQSSQSCWVQGAQGNCSIQLQGSSLSSSSLGHSSGSSSAGWQLDSRTFCQFGHELQTPTR